MSHSLDAFALHNAVISDNRVEVIGAADPSTIGDRASSRLHGYIDDLVTRPEESPHTANAYWHSGSAPIAIANLLNCEYQDFGARSVDAAHALLAAASHGARDGLLVFVRGTDQISAPFVAVFKLQLSDLAGVHFVPGRAPALALEDVDVANMLPEPKQIQKAAMFPAPNQVGDVRVVDDQIRGTADYWQAFLGAQAEPTDRARLRAVIAKSLTGLKSLDCADPDAAVSQAVALAAASAQVTSAAAFVNQVASSAGITSAALTSAVGDGGFNGMGPVTSAAAKQAKTTLSLGEEIKVVGPRGVLETRSEVIQDGAQAYLRIRLTGPIQRSYSS